MALARLDIMEFSWNTEGDLEIPALSEIIDSYNSMHYVLKELNDCLLEGIALEDYRFRKALTQVMEIFRP